MGWAIWWSHTYPGDNGGTRDCDRAAAIVLFGEGVAIFPSGNSSKYRVVQWLYREVSPSPSSLGSQALCPCKDRPGHLRRMILGYQRPECNEICHQAKW